MPKKNKLKNALVKTESLIREIGRLERLDEMEPADEKWLDELIEEVDSRIDGFVDRRTIWEGQR